MADNKKIEEIEKRLKALEESGTSKSTEKAPKKEKKPRKPSAYNEFIKTKVAELKAADSNMSHKEAWSAAIAAWKESKSS